MPDIPYANATSGDQARGEIVKLLRRVGCSQVGFLDDFEAPALVLYFIHRGRSFRLRASAAGWAAWFLRENPWHARRKSTEAEWRAAALRQGSIAVPSILRDWCKGQIAAIESGILPFEGVFGLYMLGPDGKPLIESDAMSRLLLPPPGASND